MQVDNKVARVFKGASSNNSGKNSNQTLSLSEDSMFKTVLDDAQDMEYKKAMEAYELAKEAIQRQTQVDMLKNDLEASKSQIEAMSEMMETKLKCLKISGRIINGDTVPTSDHKFLMENEPDLYSMSVNLRADKSTGKEHESLLEEEKNEDTVESTPRETVEMPQAPTPPSQSSSESTGEVS